MPTGRSMFILSINTTKKHELLYFICASCTHILHVYFSGARFDCLAYARRLDYSGRTRRSSSGLSHHLTDWLYYQPISQSVRRSFLLGVHSTADQLIGLLGAHRSDIPTIRRLDFMASYVGCTPATPGTSWRSDCSCNCRQLSWGTPRCLSSLCKSRLWARDFLGGRVLLHLRFTSIKLVCYQVDPRCSDQGADLGQHIGALISTFQAYFIWPCYKIHSSSSSRLRDYSVYTAPCGACTGSFLITTLSAPSQLSLQCVHYTDQGILSPLHHSSKLQPLASPDSATCWTAQTSASIARMHVGQPGQA
jgi:hypothetical protein